MIEITSKPISPESVVNRVKTHGSGCVAVYIGLIRDNSRGKQVVSVEYSDPEGTAKAGLERIAGEIRRQWQVEGIAISHRIGKLEVGDINFLVAVAAAHRKEAFAAGQYAVDRFKELLPTHKKESYRDGSSHIEGE
ncbi:MAG TPA: molybdenum cofactor biosynthesis protein MoaE [Dehalococcoidales bacterium]|nr:molybdenum cofactor biosynthesis protein MoaE [Dehalococcoidales bacterium]